MVVYSPTKKPQEYGFGPNDTHVIVNAMAKVAKLFDYQGNLITQIPCLADGQHPNWRNTNGDTPPGLYRLGTVYNDFAEVGPSPEFNRFLRSFGWLTFDMISLERQEEDNDREGICAHGGGSQCGWPLAWNPFQPLYPTYGCVRHHNAHLRDIILPRYQKGRVYYSVYQDDV